MCVCVLHFICVCFPLLISISVVFNQLKFSAQVLFLLDAHHYVEDDQKKKKKKKKNEDKGRRCVCVCVCVCMCVCVCVCVCVCLQEHI